MTIMMMIIEMLSALLALCERNTQVDGEFPYKWPVMWNVDVLVWCQPGHWHYVTVMPLRIKISFRRYCDWIHNQRLITLMRSLYMAHHFDAFIVSGSSLWCVHFIWLITLMRSLYMAHHFDAFIVYGSSLWCIHCIWLITMMRSLHMAHHFDAFIVSTHWGWVTHICVSKINHHWFKIMACRLIGTKPLSEPMLIHCKFGSWNKFLWNFNENSNLFIQENVFKNVACEIAAIYCGRHLLIWIITTIMVSTIGGIRIGNLGVGKVALRSPGIIIGKGVGHAHGVVHLLVTVTVTALRTLCLGNRRGAFPARYTNTSRLLQDKGLSLWKQNKTNKKELTRK